MTSYVRLGSNDARASKASEVDFDSAAVAPLNEDACFVWRLLVGIDYLLLGPFLSGTISPVLGRLNRYKKRQSILQLDWELQSQGRTA